MWYVYVICDYDDNTQNIIFRNLNCVKKICQITQFVLDYRIYIIFQKVVFKVV